MVHRDVLVNCELFRDTLFLFRFFPGSLHVAFRIYARVRCFRYLHEKLYTHTHTQSRACLGYCRSLRRPCPSRVIVVVVVRVFFFFFRRAHPVRRETLDKKKKSTSHDDVDVDRCKSLECHLARERRLRNRVRL